jgi:metal-responsive CopG/Arc/MetJ family transcriptional regulator
MAQGKAGLGRYRIGNMKTIAVTIDEATLKLLDELHAAQPGRKRSALVRAALREYAERERRRIVEDREREIFRKNRKLLNQQARALISDQARA